MSTKPTAFHTQFSSLWQRRRTIARDVEAALDRLFYEADDETARRAYLALYDDLAAVSRELAALLASQPATPCASANEAESLQVEHRRAA